MKATVGACVVVLVAAIFAGRLCAQLASQPAASPTSQPFGGKFTVGKDTTYLLGPLAADGTVDYVTALDRATSEGVTPKNNAFVLILEALGVDSIAPDVRAKTLDHLGFGPGKEKFPEDGPHLVPLHDFLKTNGMTDIKAMGKITLEAMDKAKRVPWRQADFPLLADWIKGNEKPLAKLVDASRRPRYYYPAVTPDKSTLSGMIAILMPGLQRFMEIGQMFAARAMLKLGNGDLDGAWADLMTNHRLGCLLGQSPLLITQLGGVYLRHQAFQGMKVICADVRLTAAQARKFQAELAAASPDPTAIARAFRGERYFDLYCIQVVMTSPDRFSELFTIDPATYEISHPSGLPRGINLDWDESLRTINKWYDKMSDAAGKLTWAQRLAALETLDRESSEFAKTVGKITPAQVETESLSSPKLAGRHLGNFFCYTPGFPVSQPAALTAKADEDWQLAQVALAIAAYKAEKGKFPEKLADLTPTYMKAIPPDEFTGQPLKYSRTVAGYLLYSVGPNRIDDGGVKDLMAKPEKDDIAIGIPVLQPPATTQPH